MRTYSCDRCDAKFAESRPTDPPPNPKDNTIENGLTAKLPRIVDGKIFLVEVDLCPACLRSHEEWWGKPFKKA